MIHIHTDSLYNVYLVPDSRGESSDYLPYMFVGHNRNTGREAWHEGLRKDLSLLLLCDAMHDLRNKVESYLT